MTPDLQLLAAAGDRSWNQSLWTIKYFPCRHLEALVWLKPKERMMVMRDPALLEMLVQLRKSEPGVAKAAD